MGNTAYANRKKALNNLINARVVHDQAFREFNVATKEFYTSLAEVLRLEANGAKNAKTAGYLAQVLTDDPVQRHNIATTIGVCGSIADDDCRWLHNGCEGHVSLGNTHKFLSGLRRKIGYNTTYWAEVDENGNVIGTIHERENKTHLYYWVD